MQVYLRPNWGGAPTGIRQTLRLFFLFLLQGGLPGLVHQDGIQDPLADVRANHEGVSHQHDGREQARDVSREIDETGEEGQLARVAPPHVEHDLGDPPAQPDDKDD